MEPKIYGSTSEMFERRYVIELKVISGPDRAGEINSRVAVVAEVCSRKLSFKVQCQ